MPSVHSHSSIDILSIVANVQTPALLHSTWTAPKWSIAAVASASTSASLRHVGAHADGLVTGRGQLVDGAVERRLVDLGGDDAHAGAGERPGHAQTHAGPGARDDGDLALELFHERTPWSSANAVCLADGDAAGRHGQPRIASA